MALRIRSEFIDRVAPRHPRIVLLVRVGYVGQGQYGGSPIKLDLDRILPGGYFKKGKRDKEECVHTV